MTESGPDRAAIDLLERLVTTPSPSREEHAAVSVLVSWMMEQGFAAASDEAGNAVGVRGTGPREILLLGHIDTFPGLVPVRRQGRLLYGRGAVDAKGPLAAFAAAAAAVAPPPEWRITVVGAVEEECTTSRGARQVVASRGQADPPEAVIVGEPSRWDRITLGYRGSVDLRLGLRAPFSHSAGPARLPAERAVELWQTVQEYVELRNRDRDSGEFNRYAAALRSIRTRDAGAFGEASLGIGLRLPPGETLATLMHDLRGRLRERVGSWNAGGADLAVRFRGGQEAWRGGKSNALVRAFLGAIRAERGEPRFVVKTGTADVTIVAPAWPRTPMAVYGPGDGALDHTPDEHVDLDEYLRSIRVLIRVLNHLIQSG
jgi:LysW-gamma-L-lysine carboxypeptidase